MMNQYFLYVEHNKEIHEHVNRVCLNDAFGEWRQQSGIINLQEL